MKKCIKVILTIFGLSVLLLTPTAFARGGGHGGGGHASGHASASHASAAHSSAAHAEASHSAVSHSEASHTGHSSAHTSDHITTHTSELNKSQAVRSYYNTYPGTSFHPNLYYYWMYSSMMHTSQNNSKNGLDKNQITKYGKTYWVNVGDKTINVPEKVYNQIKVGDKLVYESPTQLKINGKNVKIK